MLLNKFITYLALVLLFSGLGYSQDKIKTLADDDKEKILAELEAQRLCWNEGNLAGYMEGYWKSDSLRFIGKSGINYGWNATFENYKRGYPTKDLMGFLTFEVKSLEFFSPNTAFMIGKWDLKRKEDNPKGHFTLIWKKIKGKWLITTDHSS